MFDGLDEELALVTIGSIEAGGKEPHGFTQILHSPALEAVFPESLDREIQLFFRVELLRLSDFRRIASFR